MITMRQEQDDSDKRICDRFSINRMVQVTLPDERELAGITVNISLGGVLIKTTLPNDIALLGETAKMRLLSNEGDTSDAYDCKIVRIEANLVGLAVDKKTSAKLGKALTRGMFNRR